MSMAICVYGHITLKQVFVRGGLLGIPVAVILSVMDSDSELFIRIEFQIQFGSLYLLRHNYTWERML